MGDGIHKPEPWSIDDLSLVDPEWEWLLRGLVDAWVLPEGGGDPRSVVQNTALPLVGTPWSVGNRGRGLLDDADSTGAALTSMPEYLRLALPISCISCYRMINAPESFAKNFGVLYDSAGGSPYTCYSNGTGGGAAQFVFDFNDAGLFTNYATTGSTPSSFTGTDILQVGQIHAGGGDLLIYVDGVLQEHVNSGTAIGNPTYGATATINFGHDPANVTRQFNSLYYWGAVHQRTWLRNELDILATLPTSLWAMQEFVRSKAPAVGSVLPIIHQEMMAA